MSFLSDGRWRWCTGRPATSGCSRRRCIYARTIRHCIARCGVADALNVLNPQGHHGVPGVPSGGWLFFSRLSTDNCHFPVSPANFPKHAARPLVRLVRDVSVKILVVVDSDGCGVGCGARARVVHARDDAPLLEPLPHVTTDHITTCLVSLASASTAPSPRLPRPRSTASPACTCSRIRALEFSTASFVYVECGWGRGGGAVRGSLLFSALNSHLGSGQGCRSTSRSCHAHLTDCPPQIQQAYYRGGVFRFTVTLPDAYPADDALPSVQFHTPLYHPLVHPEVVLACVELCDVFV